MISIKKMHEWVYELKNDLSFIFVDYKEHDGALEIVSESELISIEKISWDCLSIEAQGYGVIQKVAPLEFANDQTKSNFYKGFLRAYEKYRNKEQKKHEKFEKIHRRP